MSTGRRLPAFGIDFGTTNSVAVAALEEDRLEPLLSAEVSQPHPSVVWYGPEHVIVGERAKGSFHSYHESPGHRFIRSVKRELGRSRDIDVGGRRVPAYEVAAEIFRHLRDDAERTGYRLDEAVLTVPIYFDGAQRSDIRRAAEAAGIRVVGLVHEPFAAAVAYYHGTGHGLETLPDQSILVFDWGGGTLDITLVRSRSGMIREVAIGGLPDVAGDLFDEHMQSFAKARFLAASGIRPELFRLVRAAEDRFVREAERAKIDLSSRRESQVSVARVFQDGGRDIDLNVKVTRTDFEAMIRSRIDQALAEVDRMLRDARMIPEDVDQVLLIGGTSQIPLVREEMDRIFDVRVQTVPNSQTIIAEGAALVAAHGYRTFLAAPVEMELATGSLYTIFPDGTPVPTTERRAVTLFCTDNRDGEARLIVRTTGGHSEQQGHFERVLNIPVVAQLPQPEQHEQVTADFAVTEDLVLEVEAFGAAKGEVVRMAIPDLNFGLRLR